MNMKKLAIITFMTAVLLVPGNGHAADTDHIPSLCPSGQGLFLLAHLHFPLEKGKEAA